MRCSVLALAGAASLLAPFTATAQSVELRTGDARWLAKVLRVEDTRRDDPRFVDSLLAHGRPIVRARVAVAAGRIGARTHLPALRAQAGETDTMVASRTWFALALLHDSASVPAAVAALRAAPSVATQAVRLLGETGETGRAGILRGLADSTLAPAVRGALLLAAVRLRPLPFPAIVPFVSDPDSGVAWRAAYALARGRSAAGVRALLSAAASPAASVREQVARGINRSVAGDSLADSALAVLGRLSVDVEPRVRVNASRSLASYGTRARAQVLPLLRDTSAAVRVALAQALGPVLDSDVVAWSTAYAADTGLTYRVAVADAAAARGVTLPEIAGWRDSRDWRLRAAAVSIDARGTADSAVERMRRWMHDRDARVRTTAAASLSTLTDSATASSSARVALRNALGDPDTFVRAAALSGLSSRADLEDLTRAIDVYRRSAVDTDADARLAFWQLADSALTRLGASMPDSVGTRLGSIPRPSDALERIAASHITRFASWADSTGTARPLAWYVARAHEVIARPAPIARIETDRGTLELELYASDAPLTVHNFISLAQRRYFDGQRFHRVVPNFVVQAGDPRGDGNGGPGYAIRDEINAHHYQRGTLGMALSGPNTGGSQFFITHSPQPHLDGGYTVFGQMRSGYAALDRIVQGDRIVRITVR